VRRRLQDKVGVPVSVRQGMHDTFDQMAHEVVTECEQAVPEFVTYLQSKVLPAVKDKVLLPRLTHSSIPLNWTNNQCEAMNHILKSETNWKPEKVCTLVDSIQRIVHLQLADIRQALHGQGNYQLAVHVQHLQVPHVRWAEKSQQEKDKLVQDFMEYKYKSRKRPQQLTSTDG